MLEYPVCSHQYHVDYRCLTQYAVAASPARMLASMKVAFCCSMMSKWCRRLGGRRSGLVSKSLRLSVACLWLVGRAAIPSPAVRPKPTARVKRQQAWHEKRSYH